MGSEFPSLRQYKKLTPETAAQLIERYKAGDTIASLSRQFGVSAQYIPRFLKSRGVQPSHFKLNDAQRDELMRRWRGGESPTHLAAEFGISQPTLYGYAKTRGGAPETIRTISRAKREEMARRYVAGERDTDLAREFGVSRGAPASAARSRGHAPRRRKPRCTARYDAFATITPESAYWIGFLMADGSVSDHNAVMLALAAEDAEHIRKFQFFLCATHKINVYRRGAWKGYPRQDIHKLTVVSKSLAADLAAYGVVPRKSRLERAPEALLTNRDFWRGMVDGDGWVVMAARGDITIGLCNGGAALIEQFISFTKMIAPHNNNRRVSKTDAIHTVTLTGRAAIAVIAALYSGASVALERKAAKASVILSNHQQYQLFTS